MRVDIAVVGLGPGGEQVATRLAGAGLRVAAIEARLVGGECPYYACVPTKMMIRAAHALAEARRVGELAGTAEVHTDWSMVSARIRDEATDDWDDAVAVERLTKAGVEFVRGRARITGPGELVVGDTTIHAERGIVLNPGTEPAVPPIDGLAGTPFWTNREAVRAKAVPGEVVVVGGGPVGCEFAQVFGRFGARVTVVQSADRLLPRDEPEAGELIAEQFAAEGIDVRVGAKVTSVSHDGGAFSVTVDGDTVKAGQLLIATGRRTDLKALGVGAYGLDESAKGIEVDRRMRAADGLWAIGDVTGEGAFTHMSMYQAGIAVADILGEPASADYRAVPRVTFTDPEVGAVGLTEAQARERGVDVRVGSTLIPSSSRGWIHKVGNDGFIKLVADAGRGVLVGATSVGPAGGEVLGALAVAVHAEVPVDSLRGMIFAYPTFHRAISAALDDLA
ncbi:MULTISPECIES: dihydrolipoyl dehydrogenase family protein [Actinokineospora]|uniref:Pyridine nucleotide-disulfide oxidoreductase n=1 Tax=Actinokineospora fastidiosa TaxID=1816 RepID=A0A918L6L6_9PSEU|nr:MULTISPECIES: NAD(P)/FAD-dependent oxidoreductase [Actinokineospora]UVS76929.1 Mercuric reductase [Actinokineospora sp. UTMC 2448]GGS14799.1 pyridine nucleotide-disulfide oxidoreductase [Actinokineospora fastidiosa]